MLFNYQAFAKDGSTQTGSVDAVNIDVAISSLQRRGLVITSIDPAEKKSWLELDMEIFETVSNRDVVILSRQIATLFEAQVSALRVFRLLGAEAENPKLRRKLTAIGDDIQGGSTISVALEKHGDVFSPFYSNMVRAGEESGKLDETFLYLADYLDRSYEVTTKARNALIYPAFVIFTFIVVMILMLTLVVPKISAILLESGQDIPIYTKIVIGASQLILSYGLLILVVLAVGAFFGWRYLRTKGGTVALARLKISTPYVGELYRKLYLSRLADNMSTMLSSGIPMVRALEITSTVIGNALYEQMLLESVQLIKAGNSVSESFSKYPEIPGIVTQMIKIGEETGELGNILKTLSRFYQREVQNAVDTLVNLIEPVMIVLLGLGVGILLASVLIPIYNISAAI